MRPSVWTASAYASLAAPSFFSLGYIAARVGKSLDTA